MHVLLKYTNNNVQYTLFYTLLFSLNNTSKGFVSCFFCLKCYRETEVILQFSDLHLVLAYHTDNKHDAELSSTSASGRLSLEKQESHLGT